MSKLLRYRYFDSPEGQDIGFKTFAISKYAAVTGAIMGVYDILMYSHPKGFSATAGRFIWYVGPMVGMAVGFTVTANAAKNIRNKDDKVNYFLGGAVAGSLLSAWQRAPIIAVPAMVVLGMAAVVKKTALEENYVFFPHPPQATKSIQSVRHDWTIAKDIEELKGYVTKTF